MANGRPAKGPERFLTYGIGNRLSGWCATAWKRYLKSTLVYCINLISRVIRGEKEDDCAATVQDICIWTGIVFVLPSARRAATAGGFRFWATRYLPTWL